MTGTADPYEPPLIPALQWYIERTPVVRDGRGPERVATEAAPSDWAPRPLIGFTTPRTPRDTADPLVWEGDGA